MGYLTAVNGFTYGPTSDRSAATIVQLNDRGPASLEYEIGLIVRASAGLWHASVTLLLIRPLQNQDYGYPALGFSGLSEDLSSGSANFVWISSSVSRTFIFSVLSRGV